MTKAFVSLITHCIPLAGDMVKLREEASVGGGQGRHEHTCLRPPLTHHSSEEIPLHLSAHLRQIQHIRLNKSPHVVWKCCFSLEEIKLWVRWGHGDRPLSCFLFLCFFFQDFKIPVEGTFSRSLITFSVWLPHSSTHPSLLLGRDNALGALHSQSTGLPHSSSHWAPGYETCTLLQPVGDWASPGLWQQGDGRQVTPHRSTARLSSSLNSCLIKPQWDPRMLKPHLGISQAQLVRVI